LSRQTKHSAPFHYSLELEYALAAFFGHDSKWYGTAGGFHRPARVRSALLAATSKIRARLEDIITADDRLLLTTCLALDAIEREAKELREGSNNQLEIIAHLLHLVANLLGYDWQAGKPNRHLVYFQTADQEWIDDTARYPDTVYRSFTQLESQKRLEIASSLYDQNLRVAQIARIMRLSEPRVKDLLVRGGRIERKSQTKEYKRESETQQDRP
jgi:hypothetical protein